MTEHFEQEISDLEQEIDAADQLVHQVDTALKLKDKKIEELSRELALANDTITKLQLEIFAKAYKES